jgi:hypothetical protein
MTKIETSRIQDEIRAKMIETGMTEDEWKGYELAFIGKVFFKGSEQVCSKGVVTTELETQRYKPRLPESVKKRRMSKKGISRKQWGSLMWAFSGVVYFIGDEQVGHGGMNGGNVAAVVDEMSDSDKLRTLDQVL